VELGHSVTFLEYSDHQRSCYDPVREKFGADARFGLAFTARCFRSLGVPDLWAYWDIRSSAWRGPAAARIDGACRDADLVLNVSGANLLPPSLHEIPIRVFVDTDPGFTQIRQLTSDVYADDAARHNVFFSFAANVGRNGCELPDGRAWAATRQPVVLKWWPRHDGNASGAFTSTLTWQPYPAQTYGLRRYGTKLDSFNRFVDLPRRTTATFELAARTTPTHATTLERNGWRVRDPREVAGDPWAYQRFIRRSKAEFGVAKEGYVTAGTGWFSERSANYLASGRPVLAQETGYSRWLESGSGVIPFSTTEEAAAGVEEVNARYDFHCRAARELAAEYFDSRRVLTALLDSASALAEARV
jgi:hypothetical protein